MSFVAWWLARQWSVRASAWRDILVLRASPVSGWASLESGYYISVRWGRRRAAEDHRRLTVAARSSSRLTVSIVQASKRNSRSASARSAALSRLTP
jgi:hypothetical protein